MKEVVEFERRLRKIAYDRNVKAICRKPANRDIKRRRVIRGMTPSGPQGMSHRRIIYIASVRVH